MSRTVGAKNVVDFEKRKKIEATSSSDIKHLAEVYEKTPFEQQKAIINHRKNYLNWLETRHESLAEAEK